MVLNSYFETGFPLPTELSKEFTKQFPNVTFNIKEDLFQTLMENSPRVLAGDNPPDLIRLPSISDLVKDGLLKNLDSLCYGVRLGQISTRRSSRRTASPTAAARAAKARSMRWVSTIR